MKEFTLVITFVLINILIVMYGQFKHFNNNHFDGIVNESDSLAPVKITMIQNIAFENLENRVDLIETIDEFQLVAILPSNNDATTNMTFGLPFFKDLFFTLKSNIQSIIEKFKDDTDAPSDSKMYEVDLIA